MITPILSHLFNRFFRMDAYRAACELAYLNGAVSIYDLECREREILQGKFTGL